MISQALRTASGKNSSGYGLLPFPHPYRSMLAICNDIDDASPQLFTAMHTYLNTEETTESGKGLGLEVADSLWLWSEDRAVTSLLDINNRYIPYAKRLAQLAADGWIDSLHSLGDFNDPQKVFTRETAELAYKTLNDLGIKLQIYINHGNQNNRQNFSCRLATTYQGDDPSSPAYHADLACRYGIRYFWWDEVVTKPLSCTSQSQAARLYDQFSTAAKNLLKKLTGKIAMRRSYESISRLALPYLLRDNSAMWAFTRHNRHPQGPWGRPGRHTFKYQLTESFLDGLAASGGFAILYTHFGQPQWLVGQPLIDQENLNALRLLQTSSQKQKVLVATTRRLLDHWRVVQFLDWEIRSCENYDEILIKGLNDPVFGFEPLEEGWEQSLTFRIPEQRKVLIRCHDRHIEPRIAVDDTGSIAFIPWHKIALPQNGFRLL